LDYSQIAWFILLVVIGFFAGRLAGKLFKKK